jgi:hypothetical protein
MTINPCELTHGGYPRAFGATPPRSAGRHKQVCNRGVRAFFQRENLQRKAASMPNPSIKDEKMYRDLRKEGSSKEKAARISNAAASRGKSSVGRKGGKSGSYDDWTVAELKKRAKELGISGYSGLSKSKLVSKLRNH